MAAAVNYLARLVVVVEVHVFSDELPGALAEHDVVKQRKWARKRSGVKALT
jgi:hypothetical protein